MIIDFILKIDNLYFFKYKFIYFNWRLITSQYCIGFAMHKHESTTGIHVFPIPNPPHSTVPEISCSQVILPALGFDTEATYVHSSKFLYRNNL